MRNRFMLLIVSAALFTVSSCFGGGGKTGEQRQVNSFIKESLSYNLSLGSPTFTNVYVDASGSMKGYFSQQSDGRFITALSNTNSRNLMWMDSGFTHITTNSIEIPTTNLMTSRFKEKETRFDTMVSGIVKKDSLCKSGGLSLLFTDGILSASPSETRQDTNVMLKSFVLYKNYIVDVLTRNSGIAAALFKLDSKYVGTYYNYKNKPIYSLNIQARPFYVLALGQPAVVRHFVANNKLGSERYETFGLYPEGDTVKKSDTYTFAPKNLRNWNGSTLSGPTIDFYLSVPQYIADFGNDYIRSNMRIYLDGQDVTDKLDTCVNALNGTNLNFTDWNVQQGMPIVLVPGTHILQLRILKSRSSVWISLYSEDDSDIKNNSAEQSRTFALKYLVDGFGEGLENKEPVLFQTSIEFQK